MPTNTTAQDDVELIDKALAAFGGRRGTARVIGISPDHCRHVRQGRKRMTTSMRIRMQQALAHAERGNN